jgi:hypothetical protein
MPDGDPATTIQDMTDETKFSGKVPHRLTKEDAEALWTSDLEEVGRFAASFVNGGEPGSLAEAAETRVLALLQARTAGELTRATDRLGVYTKVLIGAAVLQAIGVIVAAFISR